MENSMSDEKQPKRLTRQEATDVFMRHFGYVRAMAFQYAPVASFCEDIVHDTYVCFVEKAERWDYDEAKILPLLKSLVRAMAGRQYDQYKKNMPSKLREIAELLNTAHSSEVDIPDTYSGLESKLAALRCCMEKLSPESRKLIEVYYYGDANYTQVAEQLGRTPTAVYKAYARIRSVLYDCVQRIIAVEVERD